ncbi:MAG: thiamine pyrophosphate-dependent enzyme [Bacteroidota bacterium]
MKLKSAPTDIGVDILLKAYDLMCTARAMSDIYEENAKLTAKYVHATSRGHEAIQLACGMHLLPQDFVYPYYRDDSILLGIGMRPYELMLQVFAKKDDPFSGGRTYYSHPSLNDDDKPKIPHQSSATGMQAIPATGLAMGLQYKEIQGLENRRIKEKPLVVCSLGDASMTEGEISEALQMASLKKLPIIYLVQDNEWDISAHSSEVRASDASQFVKAFPEIDLIQVEGNDFFASYSAFSQAVHKVRTDRIPVLIHAKTPLLGHHTSGVRREWYRDDLEEHQKRDPLPLFKKMLLKAGIEEETLTEIENLTSEIVAKDFSEAMKAEEPTAESIFDFDFAPSPVTEEKGERHPLDGEQTLMVDCALFGIEELLRKHPEALLYGQDVGGRLGGVFREAATLAQKFGDNRVFNTPIVEAFIIGSTVGMSAVGLKPIVEVQFADYVWPGLNQLYTEASRSYYLSNGKWPVQSLIRVPIGAYGSGGPYHSSSVESVLCNIKGIKVVYPSNGADLKGLIKGAFYDPNPVVMLEHKGLYWSKLPGTEEAKSIEPDEDYIVPLGKARIAQEANPERISMGESICVVTYGMGVYWSKTASKEFEGQVEIIDLRTLVPLDAELIFERVKAHSKCLVVTEETWCNSFAQALTGFIQENCFEHLDAPVKLLGSENLPAIPLNSTLEATMIPNAEKVGMKIKALLEF